MSTRLHIQKKHVVEYADDSVFHNDENTINTILSEYCDYFGDNDESFGADTYIRVVKADLEKLVSDLESGEINENTFKTDLCLDISKEDMTIDYLVKNFKYILENCDKDCEYVYLDWF